MKVGRPSGGLGRVLYRTELDTPVHQLDTEAFEIYQDSSGGENWQSRNHVNRHGRVPCRFRGYRIKTAQGEQFGRRASPVVTTANETGAITVSVPEFWQQFPKAIDTDSESIRIGLFPREWNDLFELQGGERKTHTVWLDFASSNSQQPRSLDWAHQPARAVATPDWYCQSGAVPFLTPAVADMDSRVQEQMHLALKGEKSLLAGREVIDEYGWRNFGDVWANHEQAYYSGPRPVISHYNNQFDIIYGAILHMMRTGDVEWWEIADPLARHVMDIDLYHTDEDKSAYNGGLFWFTDHYLGAATCSHRTYSQANRPGNGQPYGGGPGSEHNFATGLLHYYYLTGDPDAREAVIQLADWVLRMDDGRRTIFRFADHSPTGLASLCGSPDFHGPGRGAANSIQVLLDAWNLAQCDDYLNKAEELIRRCIHPSDDLERLGLLNAESRWSYTMFLSALARYLSVKAEAGMFDKMYAYGRQSLLYYATWMVDHERPYLDHPDDLEYPTEAWAAQEFRKANVFWLASQFAAEPMAEKMRQRGKEFSERAWKDLLGFESRTTARAQALVMREGVLDASFRTTAPSRAPELTDSYDFGEPEEFVPQKRRAVAQLKSASGLGRTLFRLLSPRWLLGNGNRGILKMRT